LIVDKNELEVKQKVSAVMLILFLLDRTDLWATKAVVQDSIMDPWYSLRSYNPLRELDMYVHILCKMLGYILKQLYRLSVIRGYPIVLDRRHYGAIIQDYKRT
jgi:hypothetical protein